MRNADDLAMMRTHLVHYLRHHLGNTTAHTGINLIEDDGGQLHSAADHSF